MVRQRQPGSRGRARRQRGAKRNTVRTISRAVSFKPVRTKISNDPPPILRTSSGSTILPILISVGATNAPGSFKAGTQDYFSYLQLAKDSNNVLQPTGLTGADISNALFAWMQWQSSVFETSWALRKVCLWGPNPIMGTGQNYLNAEIGLRVDLGDISNGLLLHDCGTTTRRPAVAIGLPFTIWYDTPGSSLVHIFPDATEQACPLAEGYIWGKLHLTLEWRRTPSNVLATAARSARQTASTTSTTSTTPRTGRGST